MEDIYKVDFLSSPAPNAAAIRQNASEKASQIEHVLQERASKILSVAVSQGCTDLVLGAWGCGVFQNDPAGVAGTFRDLLGTGGPFWRRFEHILFAVFDHSVSRKIYQQFVERFAGEQG